MKKLGSPRVVLWILIVVLLGYVAYVYKTAGDNSTPPPRAVSQATVISDFREMKNIEVPVEPALGGQFYSTKLLFPSEFKGHVGDIFYARMEDGHVMVTLSYRIDELTDEAPTRASYTPLEDHGPDYVPAGDYTVKDLNGQEITKGDKDN